MLAIIIHFFISYLFLTLSNNKPMNGYPDIPEKLISFQ